VRDADDVALWIGKYAKLRAGTALSRKDDPPAELFRLRERRSDIVDVHEERDVPGFMARRRGGPARDSPRRAYCMRRGTFRRRATFSFLD